MENTIKGTVADASFYYASGAGFLAASHALTCPGCSSTFRAIVGTGAKAAEGFGAVYLFAQALSGAIKEGTDLHNGTCK